ncbi:DUF397 domain-containing protein [Streptomyces sp. NPDC059063]|uniref:DUF397 domain-containing protein n=1 Tax=unclassified Streptomyces TaxID=2593676 RepID=UPI0036C76C26
MTAKASVGDATNLVWFKSSYSSSSEPDDCVEVATTPGTVHIRDSKNTTGPHLIFARSTWTDFLTHASER